MSLTSAVYIRKTQESLSKYVKKPVLTEKLLSKPPFRFLHDIISSLIVSKGLFPNLFNDFEMNSSNYKDKESKLKYLNKVLMATSLSLSESSLTVKPGKILAGVEPEKTNEFLVALASLVSQRVSTNEAVQKTLEALETFSSGGGGGVGRQETLDLKKKNNKKKTAKDSKDDGGKEIEEEKEKSDEKRESKTESILTQINENPITSLENEKHYSTKDEKEKTEKTEEEKDTRNSITDLNKTKENETTVIGKYVNEEILSTFNVSSSQYKENGQGRELIKSERPSSAKPAAPRLRDKYEVLSKDERDYGRPSTGKAVIVIPDNENEEEKDENEEFVVEENPLLLNEGNTEFSGGLSERVTDSLLESRGKESGILVQTILETQNDFEDVKEKRFKNDSLGVVSSSSYSSGLHEFSTRREETKNREVLRSLRESIQSLTRFANPLGKLLNLFQEDIESMFSEIENWKREKKTLVEALREQEYNSENHVLLPLQKQLADANEYCTQISEEIGRYKVKILKNDDKIYEMIENLGKSSY